MLPSDPHFPNSRYRASQPSAPVDEAMLEQLYGTGPGQPPQKPKSGILRGLSRTVKWVLGASALLILLAVLGVFLVIRHFEAGLPSVEQLRTQYHPPQVTRILARDGTLLANLFTERRTVIPLTQVPDHAKLAFLAAEDAHFY